MLLYPFFSFLEDKKSGNSDHIDRIDIVESFIKVFGKERIESILGDREFIGDKWLKWLESEGIKFVMRIKESGQYITNSKGEFVKANQLLYSLPKGHYVKLGLRRLNKTSKYSYYLSAYRCPKTTELLVVVHSPDIKTPCGFYKYRWQIETMFKAFKSSGFNIEATRVINYDRLETLLSVMAIAFVISYEVGDSEEKKNPPKLKKHGYKPASTLKLGIRLIKNWFFNHRKLLISKLWQIVRKVDKYYAHNNFLDTNKLKTVM
tara:strand:+ start:479 stop:1264 length:786 start_codon:yes stop_codon:yes gene_type:complete